MRLGEFSLEIVGFDEREGYVSLPDKWQYQIGLSNKHNNRRADAVVTIDGKEVGTFRLSPYDIVTLERPVNSKQKFTFYKSGTKAAKKAGLDKVAKDDLGLISVTFKPEKFVQQPVYLPALNTPYYPKQPPWKFNYEDGRWEDIYGNPGPIACGGDSLSMEGEFQKKPNLKLSSNRGPSGQSISCNSVSGGTGLSGHSSQKYYDVAELDYDFGAFVEINLRLICSVGNEPVELFSVKSPRVLKNHVPRPI